MTGHVLPSLAEFFAREEMLREARDVGAMSWTENDLPPILRVLHRVFRLEPFLPISRSRPRHYRLSLPPLRPRPAQLSDQSFGCFFGRSRASFLF